MLAYFRSGWAFLIPYLAAYLLYAWLKWPVNPVAAGSSTVGGGQLAVSAIGALPSTGTPSTAHSLLSTGVPCLLHVYWFLHALHLVLGALALRAWWQGSILNLQLPTSSPTFHEYSRTRTSAEPRDVSKHQQGTGAHSAHLPSTVPIRSSASSEVGSALIWRFAPWLLLALLFYIPGLYLEYPADPFEHYARINDWARQTQVTTHIVWFKSSFFLAYSLFGWIATPAIELKLFDAYYTACCLLLCLQYHRLARAAGLGERAAFVFVLLQVVTFGNGIFGFYRYYGMSSTLFAQIGAVIATRLTLEILQTLRPQDFLRTALMFIGPLLLIATNHEQGLGLAGLGMSAVVLYRLAQWRPAALSVLCLVLLALSVATVLWFPRHPALTEFYQLQGWMTRYFSFNLFSPSSPAFDRTNMILGASGWLGFTAALWLARKNHLAGWLTLVPLCVLLLPVFTIPFAHALALRRAVPEEQIVLFHRMLLAIPSGLALTVVGSQFIGSQNGVSSLRGLLSLMPLGDAGSRAFALMLAILAVLLTLPAQAPYFNRLWNAFTVAPADLTMNRPLVTDYAVIKLAPNNTEARVLSGPGYSFVFYAAGVNQLSYPKRLISLPPTSAPSKILPWVLAYTRVSLDEGADIRLVIPRARQLFTPGSQTALLSQHWLPYEVAIEYAGGPELEHQARLHAAEGRMIAITPFFYRTSRWPATAPRK